jgi:uncharacterized SAM-binding protein YcdF (DUF218 family)
MSAAIDKLPTEQTRRRSLGKFAVVAALFFVFGASLWLGRVQILRSAAAGWIVSDSIAPADAVAIFGGGVERRPFAAADYFHRNLVKRALISNISSSKAEALGALPSHTNANRNVLLKLGVPEGAIEIFGDRVSNTYDEALALRAWAERNGIHAIIVPTEIFPSRRVNWILRRVFQNTNIRVQVVALESGNYTREDWWRHEQGLLQFQNEIIKYLYYRWKY